MTDGDADSAALGPITDVAVFRGGPADGGADDSDLPAGWHRIRKTVGDSSANVAGGVPGAEPLWLCVKRDPGAAAVVNLGVIWEGMEAPAEGQTVVTRGLQDRRGDEAAQEGKEASPVATHLNPHGSQALVAKICLATKKEKAQTDSSADHPVLVDVTLVREDEGDEATATGWTVLTKTCTNLRFSAELNAGCEKLHKESKAEKEEENEADGAEKTAEGQESGTAAEADSEGPQTFHLAVKYAPASAAPRQTCTHPCNGSYDTRLGTLRLTSVRAAPGTTRVTFKFDLWRSGSGGGGSDASASWSDATALLLDGDGDPDGGQFLAGRWQRGKTNGAFTLDFRASTGNRANTKNKSKSKSTVRPPAPYGRGLCKWSTAGPGKSKFAVQMRTFVRDAYLKIAFKRDFATFYRGGRVVYSSVCRGNSIDDILAADVAVMGGSNAVAVEEEVTVVDPEDGATTIQTREVKRDVVRRSVIVKPPRHLIVTVQRSKWDPNTQKLSKDLRDVTFRPILRIPEALTEADAERLRASADGSRRQSPATSPEASPPASPPAGTNAAADAAAASRSSSSRAYGLYGVVVHAGTTANSGHYYSFARHSDAPDLFRADSKHSPWMKFNDESVRVSSWSALTRHIRTSRTASAYLLFYRQLAPGYAEAARLARSRRSTAPRLANDDVLRPVPNWRNNDPRWSVLPSWLDGVSAKEQDRMCQDVPARFSTHFRAVLAKDAAARTGIDAATFRGAMWGGVGGGGEGKGDGRGGSEKEARGLAARSVTFDMPGEKDDDSAAGLLPGPDACNGEVVRVSREGRHVGYILASQRARHEEVYGGAGDERSPKAAPAQTLRFPSAPRLRISSSTVEESAMRDTGGSV